MRDTVAFYLVYFVLKPDMVLWNYKNHPSFIKIMDDTARIKWIKDLGDVSL